MHNRIICLSVDPTDSCPLNECDDYSVIGADYGGESYPQDAESVAKTIFKDVFDFIKIEGDDNADLLGQLQYNGEKPLKDYVNLVIDIYKRDIDSATADSILKEPFPFSSIQDINSTLQDIVFMDGQFLTPFEFMCDYYKYREGIILYVIGCIDFHY